MIVNYIALENHLYITLAGSLIALDSTDKWMIIEFWASIR